MERAGLSYDVIRSLNEHIVYCSISGFAEDGPNRSRPAFDTIGQAPVRDASICSSIRSSR